MLTFCNKQHVAYLEVRKGDRPCVFNVPLTFQHIKFHSRYILVVICSDMNHSLSSICFSLCGTNIQLTTRILLDKMISLLFQTENQGRLPTWANPQAFLDTFRSKYKKDTQ